MKLVIILSKTNESLVVISSKQYFNSFMAIKCVDEFKNGQKFYLTAIRPLSLKQK